MVLNHLSRLFSKGFVIFVALFSLEAYANTLAETDIQYICHEISNIKEALDNAYCHSSNAEKVKDQCGIMESNQPLCSVEVTSPAVMSITLGFKENTDENEKKKGKKQHNEVVDSDSASTPSFSLKCVNSIKNTWHCGYSSTSYHSVPLSKVNKELKQKLTKELFDTAESAISKI